MSTRHRSDEAPSHLISERIKFLTHQTALASPPSNFAVHEIEKQAKRDEGQGNVHICVVVGRAKAVAKGGEDGHETAEACPYYESVHARSWDTAGWHDERQEKAKNRERQNTIHLSD